MIKNRNHLWNYLMQRSKILWMLRYKYWNAHYQEDDIRKHYLGKVLWSEYVSFKTCMLNNNLYWGVLTNDKVKREQHPQVYRWQSLEGQFYWFQSSAICENKVQLLLFHHVRTQSINDAVSETDTYEALNLPMSWSQSFQSSELKEMYVYWYYNYNF